MEFTQNKKYLDFVLSKKKEAELVYDKIAQEEAEKQFQKVQSIWMKEEAERIELLKQVYKEREEAVMHKSIFLLIYCCFIKSYFEILYKIVLTLLLF